MRALSVDPYQESKLGSAHVAASADLSQHGGAGAAVLDRRSPDLKGTFLPIPRFSAAAIFFILAFLASGGCSTATTNVRIDHAQRPRESVAFGALEPAPVVHAGPLMPWGAVPGAGLPGAGLVTAMPGPASTTRRESTVAPAISDDRPDRLSVLTFNMWHRDKPNELQALADRLRSDLTRLPDFILLQEVVFGRSKLPQEENTAAVLASFLGFHCQGTQRTSDREGVAIISRHPFDYYAERHLESQTSRLLLGFNRVSVMGEFLLPGVGRVRVVNVHFTNWGFESRVRTAQLNETLHWMAEREQDVHAEVVFLGGDFNLKPQWDEMELITNAASDPLLRLQNHNDAEVPTKGSPGSPRQRIDYIFISAPGQNIALRDEQTLWPKGMTVPDDESQSGAGGAAGGSHTIYLSDHVPLLHEYTLHPAVIAAAPSER
jgi:endonuclease/exonuclease/phosphatase family metal-dependent hydrolase